ncbi:MAG TPA: hypothetical protein VFM58_08055 [Solirubrobacteraceae bacterium]|nr:hypothetical protein [Solirubrobacteraceae bacterium]
MGPADQGAPDLIHAVIGFRQWRLDQHGLLSLTRNDRWRGRECAAVCSASRHAPEQAPVNGCACGVYAWYDPCPRTGSAPDYVSGAVVLWGRLELHATGMRAQNGRLVALALPLSRWGKRRRVVALADFLSVPAVPHRALRYVALAHGRPVPSRLRPPRSWATVPQP